ncbi:hypothetical protein [Parenemella sanctibonifatiensis]|nr:hypothetical protein [Parenemella sanctibonifatiensis]
MSSKPLRRAMALLLAFGCLVLTGCVRVEARATIDGEGKVHAVVDINVDTTAVQASGEQVCDYFSAAFGLSGTPYSLTDRAGCLAEGDVGPGSAITVRHVEDTFVFEFALPAGDPTGGNIGAAGIESFTVAVSFPGTVREVSGTGEKSGNTATWTDPADLFSSAGLRAVGADGSGWSSLVWIGLIVLVLAAVGAIIYLALRKPKAPPPPPNPFDQAGGPGQFGGGQQFGGQQFGGQQFGGQQFGGQSGSPFGGTGQPDGWNPPPPSGGSGWNPGGQTGGWGQSS